MRPSKGRVHIGTSGFSYRHWRGGFYPEGVKPRAYLAYYAARFSATEINASFYRLPELHTVNAWAAVVPEGFLFSPKMSRYLTHMKKLRDPEEPLQRFFGVFGAIADKLGPVLFQLPDRLIFRPEMVAHLYGLLRRDYARYEFVMEIRHPSWLSEESLQLMQDDGIGLVIAQSGIQLPYSERVTARNVYLRFHGPRELYASAYSEEDLQYYASRIRDWTAAGHTVWAFFNNDIHGYAPVDAARLKAMVRDQLPGQLPDQLPDA